MSAYLLGGYVVVGLAFWQFASRVTGMPFPDTILYSNPSWAIVEQMVGSVPRIQGPFSEPAGLAFYLSGLCFCCLWLTAHGHRLMHVTWLLALAIVAMLLSTSTTGILTLAVGLPLILVFAAARADGQALARLARTAGMLMLVGLIVLAPVFIMKPELLDAVTSVVDSTLTKSDSDSYLMRTATDTAALDTISATYGLGVGWGSFRSSSLLPGLVANAGIFGVVAVLWLALRTTQLARRRKPGRHSHPGQLVVHGFSAALCGQLTAALFSAPTIASLAFFLQLGCVIGISARMSIEPVPAGPHGVRRHDTLTDTGRATTVPATASRSLAA
jgi:energy-coupling factor transporter transmembrane protein EcfT